MNTTKDDKAEAMQIEELKKITANWNGEFMPLTEVRVSVLDRGFLLGDAVYEVIRIYGGRLFRIDDHLDRLKNSLASLDIRYVDFTVVRERIEQTTEKSGLANALLYLQVTRGEAPRTHYYPEKYTPNILMYAQPFDDPYADARASGVGAVTTPDIRWARNDIKATSLVANCMAAQQARSKGAMEVVFIDSEGFMTEGSHTSLFGIKNGKLLVSPSSSKVLPGITKRQVLELAEKIAVPLEEKRIKEAEIFELDEFFLAGTPEELISIVQVNEKPVGDGKPGPVVKRLHEAFRDTIASGCNMKQDLGYKVM